MSLTKQRSWRTTRCYTLVADAAVVILYDSYAVLEEESTATMACHRTYFAAQTVQKIGTKTTPLVSLPDAKISCKKAVVALAYCRGMQTKRSRRLPSGMLGFQADLPKT